MAIISKPTNAVYRNEHDRIFKRLNDSQRLEAPKPTFSKQKDERPRVLDSDGREVTNNIRAKNSMYGEAKHLKEEIRGMLCSMDECWKPTKKNVDSMLSREMSPRGKQLIERYTNLMRAQGAPRSECGVEGLRRKRGG